jgi:RND family efflux transporter MFP subunit
VKNRFFPALALTASAAVFATACSGDKPADAAQSNASGQPGAQQAGRAAGEAGGSGNSGNAGGARGAGGPNGGRGGRGGAITLAATDVATVKRESLDAGIAITGDLRPIETIGVRARIEGDLTGVFVREGQRVSAGELLARFESGEQESTLSSAQADVQSAKTDLATAQWNYDQNKELFKAGAIAERDLKVTEQAVESAKARLAAANARLKSTSNVSRDTRVLAPAAGVIDKRLVQNGERVTRGQQLFTLVRTDELELAASVPAKQASTVMTGQPVHFVADGKEFDGRVARVSPTIDPASRAITVYVNVRNPSGALKGGTFASGRVVQRTVNGALVVPLTAVRQAQETGQTYVYRIANRTVESANITLGVIDERAGKAEVLDGLSENDQVIVGNVGTLGRGMAVTVLGQEGRGGNGGGNRAGKGGSKGGSKGGTRGSK